MIWELLLTPFAVQQSNDLQSGPRPVGRLTRLARSLAAIHRGHPSLRTVGPEEGDGSLNDPWRRSGFEGILKKDVCDFVCVSFFFLGSRINCWCFLSVAKIHHFLLFSSDWLSFWEDTLSVTIDPMYPQTALPTASVLRSGA